jgi:hypothetical protein
VLFTAGLLATLAVWRVLVDDLVPRAGERLATHAQLGR